MAWTFCAACVSWSTDLLDHFMFALDRRVETYHRGVKPSNVNTDNQSWTTPLRRATPDLLIPNL